MAGQTSRTRDTEVAGNDETEGPIDGFVDADAGGHERFPEVKPVIADLKPRFRVGEVQSVVAGSNDRHGLAQAAGARRQLACQSAGWRATPPQPAIARHLFEAGDRFESSQENTAGLTFSLAGDIHAEVPAVDGVHVGMAGMAEKDLVPGSGTAMGVGRRVGRVVVGTHVGFDFNDSADEGFSAGAMDQKLAQKARGDEVGAVFEEGAREKLAGKRSLDQRLLRV
jgi:hypothetical protein